MTLKEKFHQWLKTDPFGSKDRVTLREAQCEVIAEEFAIEFAEWLIDGHVSKLTLEEFKKQKENNMCQYCGLENDNHKLSCPVIKVTMII